MGKSEVCYLHLTICCWITVFENKTSLFIAIDVTAAYVLCLIDQLASLHSAPLRYLVPLSLDGLAYPLNYGRTHYGFCKQTLVALFGDACKRNVLCI